MIRSVLGFGAKTACLWVAILVSSIIAAMLIGLSDEGVGTDGPLTGGQAFLLVNGFHAFILSMIARHARVKGWQLALLVGATLFFAQSFFLLMEAIYFRDNLKIPLGFLFQGSLHVLIVAVMAGIVASFLWRTSLQKIQTDQIYRHMPLRIALVAIVYVISYFLAGYFIAWAAPAVQAYYDFGENIALLPLLSFQLLRGAMWACLAFFLIWGLRAGTLKPAILTGAAFSVLAAAQLLYPSTIMPWEVRLPHMIEVGISNFVFGAIAVFILKAKQSQHIT